jgi:D-amino-acid oxidase
LKAKHILILGAGVSGLSAGILLLKAGFEATIWAKDLPPNTTSNKAGAFWYPFLCDPKDKVTKWARATLEYLHSSGILDDPLSGCEIKTMTEVLSITKDGPWWQEAVDSYLRPSPEELPKGYADGYQIEAPLMDTSVYMSYLLEMYERLGGMLVKKEVQTIQEALADNPVVVNCTGLGSRELFNDQRLYPVRGQTVIIKPNGFNRILFDDEGPNKVAIIVPRTHDIVLGTTMQAGDWDTEINPGDTKDILRRCANLDQAFEHVEIIGESVGLRPARNEVRLEAENFAGKTVIHNYGHGGSGFTLSWGCALDVVGLVKKCLATNSQGG